ncbi:MAG TPA: hypothetical protein VEA60_06250 [Allosphingosinicella sp.]|nr:hypothetical protein [Allosphingosinicella sp.]
MASQPATLRPDLAAVFRCLGAKCPPAAPERVPAGGILAQLAEGRRAQ